MYVKKNLLGNVNITPNGIFKVFSMFDIKLYTFSSFATMAIFNFNVV